MKQFTLIAALCAVVILGPGVVRADSIQESSLEFNARALFEHASLSDDAGNDEDFTEVDVAVGLGYFFTSLFEVTGDMTFNHFSFGDLDVTSVGLLGSALFNFSTSGSMVPFVGIGFGFRTNGGDTAADETEFIAPRLTVGMRFLPRDIFSLNVFAGYEHTSNALGFEDVDSDDIFLGFGVSVFLKGGAGS